MSLLIKLGLIAISLLAFVFFIYKFEYIVILGFVTSALDQTDFFNPLFFGFAFFLGMVISWVFYSNLFGLFGIIGKKKYFLIALVVSLKIATPFYMFKESLWLNSVFCPTLTIHGLASNFKDSAPQGILTLSKSIRERCVLKSFIDKRDQDLREQVFVDFTGFVSHLNVVTIENLPLLTITSLNLSYPYFGKEEDLSAKIEAFTSSIESINNIFKKKESAPTMEMTLLDTAINLSNRQITKAFNQTFAVYMEREFKVIKNAYLSSKRREELKVSFDFMKIRYELLKENLSETDKI